MRSGKNGMKPVVTQGSSVAKTASGKVLPKMENSKYIGPSLTAAALLVAFLTLVLYLWHEKDHDKKDYTVPILIVGLVLVTITVAVVAAYRNFRDARRAISLQAKIDNIEYEYKLKTGNLEKELKKQSEQHSECFKAYLKDVEEGQERKKKDRDGVTFADKARDQAFAEVQSLKQEIAELHAVPVIAIVWEEGISERGKREHEFGVETFQDLGLPKEAARRAAIGAGKLEKEGFRLLYNGSDDPLQNVTIKPLSRGEYSATFETIPFLEKGKPDYLIPDVFRQRNPDLRAEFSNLFQMPDQVLKFTVVGNNKGTPFEKGYRAERITSRLIEVFPDDVSMD